MQKQPSPLAFAVMPLSSACSGQPITVAGTPGSSGPDPRMSTGRRGSSGHLRSSTSRPQAKLSGDRLRRPNVASSGSRPSSKALCSTDQTLESGHPAGFGTGMSCLGSCPTLGHCACSRSELQAASTHPPQQQAACTVFQCILGVALVSLCPALHNTADGSLQYQQSQRSGTMIADLTCASRSSHGMCMGATSPTSPRPCSNASWPSPRGTTAEASSSMAAPAVAWTVMLQTLRLRCLPAVTLAASSWTLYCAGGGTALPSSRVPKSIASPHRQTPILSVMAFTGCDVRN